MKLGMGEVGSEFDFGSEVHREHLLRAYIPRSTHGIDEPCFRTRCLLDRVCLDDAFHKENDSFEHRARLGVIARAWEERAQVFEEMARASLHDHDVAKDEFCRVRDFGIPITNERNQAIIERFQGLKIQDEIDARFSVGKDIMGKISGTVVDAAEPAHLVHPSELVIAEFRAVEFRRECVVHAYDFAVHDENAGPARQEFFRDRLAVRKRGDDAVHDPHDSIFVLAVTASEDSDRGSLQAFMCDSIARRAITSRRRQSGQRAGETARMTRDADRHFPRRNEQPAAPPFRLQGSTFRASNASFF